MSGGTSRFQSRAGFSECLDLRPWILAHTHRLFQSRAGFSECLDFIVGPMGSGKTGFNPVLGFLSVSTLSAISGLSGTILFQSRAGFSECLDHRG